MSNLRMTPLKQLAAYALVRGSRLVHPSEKELERLHLDPDSADFNDSSYFFGSDGEGLALATRLAFRTGKPDEAWLELRMPGGERLRLAGGPGERGRGFRLGQLRFTCLELGRRWQIAFDGVVEGNRGERPLSLDAVFIAGTPIIDFGRYSSSLAVATELASRRWTAEFFEKLREIRKVHYEQGGRLIGRLAVGGQELALDLPAVRDHSYGRRVWGQWSRHLWILGALEDGSYFNASMICYDFLGTLRAGWRARGGQVEGARGREGFEHFGPAGEPPDRFAFDLTTSRWGRERIEVAADDSFDFELDRGEYRIKEWIARFNVAGVPGVGVAEFGWNPRAGTAR